MAPGEEKVELVGNQKAKAAIWNHLKLKRVNGKFVPNVAVCNYCNEPVKYAGGTTNIIGHMRRHHGNISIDGIDPIKSSSVAPGAAKVKSGQMTLHTLVNGTFGIGTVRANTEVPVTEQWK